MDLSRASIRAAATRIGSIAAWALLAIVTARALSVSDRGTFAAAILTAEIAARLAANFTAGSVHQVAGRRRAPGPVLHTSLLVAAAAGALLVAATVGTGLVVVPDHRAVVLLVAAAMPASIVRQVYSAIFLATGDVGRSLALANGGTYLGFALVTGLLLATDERSPEATLGAWVTAQYVNALVAVFIARHWTFAQREAVPGLARSLITFGTVAGLSGFVSLLERRVDLLLVAGLDGASGAALYSAATSLAELLLVFPSSVAAAATASLGASGPRDAATLLATCWRHAVLLAGAGVAGVLLLGPLALEIAFGSPYAESASALRILALATPLLAPQAIVSAFLVVRLGRPGLALAVVTTSTVVELALSLYLIPAMGISGAALADFVGYGAGAVAATAIVARIAGVGWSELWIPRLSDVAAYRYGWRAAVLGRRPPDRA